MCTITSKHIDEFMNLSHSSDAHNGLEIKSDVGIVYCTMNDHQFELDPLCRTEKEIDNGYFIDEYLLHLNTNLHKHLNLCIPFEEDDQSTPELEALRESLLIGHISYHDTHDFWQGDLYILCYLSSFGVAWRLFSCRCFEDCRFDTSNEATKQWALKECEAYLQQVKEQPLERERMLQWLNSDTSSDIEEDS